MSLTIRCRFVFALICAALTLLCFSAQAHAQAHAASSVAATIRHDVGNGPR